MARAFRMLTAGFVIGSGLVILIGKFLSGFRIRTAPAG